MIPLSVLRLQVVQNTLPGSGKQVQLLQEPCLLPIHSVGTEDTGSECATIAQLQNQGGMSGDGSSLDGSRMGSPTVTQINPNLGSTGLEESTFAEVFCMFGTCFGSIKAQGGAQFDFFFSAAHLNTHGSP